MTSTQSQITEFLARILQKRKIIPFDVFYYRRVGHRVSIISRVIIVIIDQRLSSMSIILSFSDILMCQVQ